MPYQGGRYLPPIATPVQSTYQKDFITQSVTPPQSFKHRSISSLRLLGMATQTSANTLQMTATDEAKKTKSFC
ncbi:hypothetical protein ACROYT_G018340 [Oculina patagonica]